MVQVSALKIFFFKLVSIDFPCAAEHASYILQVSVYYVGTLAKDIKRFDSCQKGKPFRFRLGRGEVIKGWDTGLIGELSGLVLSIGLLLQVLLRERERECVCKNNAFSVCLCAYCHLRAHYILNFTSSAIFDASVCQIHCKRATPPLLQRITADFQLPHCSKMCLQSRVAEPTLS